MPNGRKRHNKMAATKVSCETYAGVGKSGFSTAIYPLIEGNLGLIRPPTGGPICPPRGWVCEKQITQI